MHYAWIITFAGILVFLLSQGSGKMSYPVILPSMKDGLSLTYTQVGLIGTGDFIGYFVLATVGGFLSARFGALSGIIFGITAFAIPVILAAAVGDVVGGQLAAAGFGFITLFFGIGQAFAPFIGGWIKDTTGTFTNAFSVCTAVALLGAFFSFFLKKRI